MFGAFTIVLSNFLLKDEVEDSLFLLENPTGMSSSDDT